MKYLGVKEQNASKTLKKLNNIAERREGGYKEENIAVKQVGKI